MKSGCEKFQWTEDTLNKLFITLLSNKGEQLSTTLFSNKGGSNNNKEF